MSPIKMTRNRDKIKAAGAPSLVPLLCALVLAIFSCEGGRKAPFLPPTHILRIESRWAVVKVAYARVKADPSSNAKDIAYLREGTLVEVFAREYGRDVTEEEKGYWLGVKVEEGTGWVFSGYLDVFDRKEQALRASGGGK